MEKLLKENPRVPIKPPPPSNNYSSDKLV